MSTTSGCSNLRIKIRVSGENSKIIYIQIRWQVETSFLNCLQQTTNFCTSQIKCKERHLQQIDYFLYSFLPLLPSIGNTHLCYINIQYAYCILYSSSVAIWTCLTNKIKFQGNTNIQYAFVYVMIRSVVLCPRFDVLLQS